MVNNYNRLLYINSILHNINYRLNKEFAPSLLVDIKSDIATRHSRVDISTDFMSKQILYSYPPGQLLVLVL
jgi:hypothetical protein